MTNKEVSLSIEEVLLDKTGEIVCGFANIKKYSDKEGLALTDYMGCIPTSDEWKLIKLKIDEFYKYTSDKAIEIINRNRFHKEPFKEPLFRITFENNIDGDRKFNNNEHKGYVYLIKVKVKDGYKIGFTRKSLRERFSKIACKLKTDINCVSSITTENPERLESYFHCLFNEKRIKGEYFDLSSEDIDIIQHFKEK